MNTISTDDEMTTTQYYQLCVFENKMITEKDIYEFETSFLKDGYRVKFADCVKVNTKQDDGASEDADRYDVLFWVHELDFMNFSNSRMKYGVRWWEDVLYYDGESLYPNDILRKYPIKW